MSETVCAARSTIMIPLQYQNIAIASQQLYEKKSLEQKQAKIKWQKTNSSNAPNE